MAIVWHNDLDGVSGAITTANSGNYGDALNSVSGTALYSTQQRVQGTGVALLGPTGTGGGSGSLTIAVSSMTAWSLRLYFYVTNTRRILVIQGATTLFNHDTDSGTYSVMGVPILATQANQMLNRWVRLEIVKPTSSSGGTYRFWWTDPHGTGTPNHQGSHTSNLSLGTFIIQGQANVPLAGQVFVDALAVAQGELIGPRPIGNTRYFDNTFDGPDGVVVTAGNSASYGDPVTSAIGNPTYSDDWTALGSGSVFLRNAGTSLAAAVFLPNVDADYMPGISTRFYFMCPATNGNFEAFFGGASIRISSAASIYTVPGADLAAQAANLVGRTVRCEMLWVDWTITTRLWWTNPHSGGAPDFEQVHNTTNEAPISGPSFQGTGNTGNGSYVDEVALAESGYGWIGPAVIGAEVEGTVVFSATADGEAALPGNVATTVDFAASAAGGKSMEAFPDAGVLFSAEVEHVASESGVANTGVTFSAEADGEPQHAGDISAGVQFSGEIEHTRDTTGEAEAGVVFDGIAFGQFETSLPDTVRVGLRYRLVTYYPNGDRIGQIPLPLSFSVGVPLNDLPSLMLEYLKAAPGFERLNGHVEVAVELATLAQPQFVEYPGMRFLSLRDGEDPTDRTGVVRYTLPHYGWQLRKARNLNVAAHDENDKRQFSAATPGLILHTLLSEAQARGWNPGMSWDFTPQRDSAGRVWESVYTIAFDLGQDLWTILSTLADQGAFDWRFDKRTLQVYNPDTFLNRDRTTNVTLQLARDITEAPNDRTSEELAARTLVKGDGNNWVMITQNDSQRPWGTWEDYISQSGVTNTATLENLGRWWLQKSRQPLIQMTRGILFPTTRYMPFRDYRPGDTITAPANDRSAWGMPRQAPLRVRQITLASMEGQGMQGGLVLNERFIEANLRRDRQLNALAGGAGNNPGGGGGRPGDDTRTPKAPTDLILNSNTYINEIGEPRGQITATWTPVTQATNNTAMDMRSYEVWVRLNEPGEPWWLWTTVDYSENTAHMGPFDPERVYQVRIRAIGRNGFLSAFSAVNQVRVDKDAIPPDVPSDPDLETRLGVVRVTWDGLSEFGTPMPLDFDFVTVWMSQDAVQWEAVDTLYRQGVAVIPNLPYDTEFWFRFTATDRSGNESEPSGMGSISVQQLVPGDITPGSIGYELLAEGAVRDDILADDAVRNRHIAAGEVTGEKIRAYSIFADRIAVGNTRNLLTDPKHTNTDLNQLRLDLAEGNWAYNFDATNSQDRPYIWRQNNPNGTYRYYWIQSLEATDLSDPSAYFNVASELGRIIGSARVTVGGRTAGTATVTFFARLLDRQGNLLGSAPAVIATQTFSADVANHEMISNTGAAIPTEAAFALFYTTVVFNGTNDNMWVGISRPFTALSNGAVLIENGAISANKIAANAVTADKIQAGAIQAVHIQADAIDTTRLRADAITAKHTITGATIQTTASANRGLKITSTGMRGYDNVGNETFLYEAASGVVRTTGRFQTGVVSGNNVVIDSNLYQGRPAVQLNTGGTQALQPVMYSLGAGSGGYPAGALIIHGRETTINSSGRSTLRLDAGTSGSLEREWGPRAGMGFRFNDWEVNIWGRTSIATGSLDNEIMFRSSRSGSSGAPIVNWTFTYGSSAPNGGRMMMLAGFHNQNSTFIDTAVTGQNLGNGFAASRRDPAGSHRVQYVVKWFEQSVSGA